MPKQYETPPVIEAVCEFKLTPETPWDLTIPGLVYEKIENEFKKKEEHSNQEVTFSNTPKGLEQQIQTSQRIRFLTDDKKTFVQLGTRILSVNQLQPYTSWEEFKPKIKKAFIALTEIIEINNIERIGLRYVNRIDIPIPKSGKIDMEEYFDFSPHVGKNLPQDYQKFIVGAQFPFKGREDICKVLLTDTVPNKPESASFILDLDYFFAKPQTVSKDTALEWVESAHNNLEGVFEGCITDRLRRLFKEVD